MATVIPISKRDTVTLPPDLCRRLGLKGLENPMLIAEEQVGKLILSPATAVPVRDLSEAQLRLWISEDELEMQTFENKRKALKR